MPEDKTNIEYWLEKLRAASNSVEIMAILDEFRDGEWSDADRAKVSHTYMRKLNALYRDPKDSSSKKNTETAANEGPVWYEKM